MLNPLALSRGSHYLENALRLAALAEIAYRDDPITGLVPFADHYRRIQPFSKDGTFGFVASDERNLVLALRGTDQIIDWITNLEVAQIKGLGGYVHQGFWDSLESVWDEILKRVEDLLDAGQTVWVTGHSLGGALATLASARLQQAGIEPYITCTFGAPRVLDPKAAATYLPRLYRFANKGDLVPTVPPSLTLPWYWYQHTGSLAVVLDAERGAAASLNGKEQDLFSLARWLASPAIDWQKNITQRLTDHAMKTYMALIKAELGPEAVARIEREQPAVPVTRIKPRRAA
jgi:hypothetical protein